MVAQTILVGWRRRVGGCAGVTLPELLVALAVVGFVGTMGAGSLAQYREATSTSRASRTVQADMVLARSLAIRNRAPVSVVARESQRLYEIRDTLGTVYHRRVFDGTTDLTVSGFDVQTPGDSVTFDQRGILVTGGTVQVTVTRGSRTRTIVFNALGRSRIN